MNNEKHVILDGFEIVCLQVAIDLELLEAVQVVDLASQHEYERLHFTDELIGQVDFGNVRLLIVVLNVIRH